MTRDEVINLFEMAEIPESVIKEINRQHDYFTNNLLTRRGTMTKELYIKFLNERIEKASQGIQDAINLQMAEDKPENPYLINRIKVYRLCQKNIAYSKNEINIKHTSGQKADKKLTFVDLFTGENPADVAKMVINILTDKGFIDKDTGRWIKPDYNTSDNFIAKPFHVLRDNKIIIDKPVDEPYKIWCNALGWDMTCTVKALKSRRKGGKEFEEQHDRDYKNFVDFFAAILIRSK